MNLPPEDPRLTAYVLGELGPEEAAAVEQAMASTPPLQAEVEGIRHARDFLNEHLTPSQEKLLPAQRETIRQSANTRKIRPSASLPERLQVWIIPAAAAAVLAVATTIFLVAPGAQKPVIAKISKVAPTAKLTPPPKLAPPAVPTANLSFSQRGSTSAAEFPTLDLPLEAVKPSLPALSHSIRTQGKLPARESIHLEEMLNSFTYRLNGTAAIARGETPHWHPDSRDTGISPHLATLTTEMIACPWKPSSTLLFISLRSGTQDGPEAEVQVAYHADPTTVRRYQLLGFTTTDPKPAGKSATRLTKNSVVTLAIEIEPATPGTDLGSLVWSVAGTAAPEIHLTHRTDAAPSDDARLAALVCTYSQWLRGEQTGIIDAALVFSLAREITSPTLPPDRTDFLQLIEKSLR